MLTRRGIAVSPGIAIGPALVLDTEGFRIPTKTVAADQVDAEIARLSRAIHAATMDSQARQKLLTDQLGTAIGNIFFGHSVLLSDQMLRYEVEQRIRSESFSAEAALVRSIRAFVNKLDESGAGEKAQRLKADFIDIEKQILKHLLGDEKQSLHTLTDQVIVLGHDLTPSETALLPKEVLGFATESGGPTSHTAILANAMGTPAVVGLGRFLNDVSGGDWVIIDGNTGTLIVDPDEPTLARYEAIQSADLAKDDPFIGLRELPSITKCGVRITLLGNIEFPTETQVCIERGADGVGLYRTEFLYLNKSTDPTEDEHFEAYKAVLTAMGDKPVVIRTLDLGADKFSNVTGDLLGEKNPFLGLRSIRLCLKHRGLFRTQLRALLRASVHGSVRVMFPMVSTLMELRAAKAMWREAQEDLDDAGIPYKRDVPIGTMIEVPSAAILADAFAKEVDFFSIGTNDLVQYTLAADRNNENVGYLYDSADPAVLRLIETVVKAGAHRDISVNVCGEMSGDPVSIPLLLGLGIRHLSASPRKLPEIKRVVRAISLAEAQAVAERALQAETPREVTNLFRDYLRRILPDAAD
jgi:phosphotransferase system enzyme I (PtsI)